MNSPETNDPLEKLLREQHIYIPDIGFTKQVVGSKAAAHGVGTDDLFDSVDGRGGADGVLVGSGRLTATGL